MAAIQHYPCFIDGVPVDAASGAVVEVDDPATGEIWATVPDFDADDAARAIESAHAAQRAWADLPAIERGRWVGRLAQAVEERRAYFVNLLVREQGKPAGEADAEVTDTVTYLSYAAEAARRIEGKIFPSENPGEQLWIQSVPYGATVGMCAYNYPLALIGRKVGPALVTGNTMVLKPHEATPVTASEFCRLAAEIGLPEGVLNVVTGSGIEASSALVTNPLTRLVSLTGSTRAGQAIYRSVADNVPGLVLELGGKASFIVLEDADLDTAVEAAVTSRFVNAGQVCICNELVLVHEAIAEEFTARVAERVREIQLADPADGTGMGPSSTGASVERIDGMLRSSVEMGATVEVGGARPSDPRFARGHWYLPTVVSGVTRDMPLATTEIFGPILPIVTVADYAEALEICNDREDALSAYIFTRDASTIFHAINHMEVGTVFVNQPITGYIQGYHSGHKRSGLAGEDGVFGIESYLQRRTVYLNYG
ncbi:aldehyde dehydrogenase [Agromyces rhizosphaerae]|uniref:Aldehyde dehydrogenase n=1 Tax=Agromyces rhizosphaerae TaxID=88374 RepID=A0A9W6CUI5_9MICO|nr:aldehyde dehydrogenase family protein [Agromyces rhizosphaerae]GLI26635.1 aldehyde dehydrogenase [Agromyces rhizosphaerae]